MYGVNRHDKNTATIDRIDITIFGNKEIKNTSALGKDTPGLISPDLHDNNEPKKGGLVDARMGVTSNELDCATCGLSTNYCPGHFGHLDLSEAVYHMGYFEYIISILNCVCVQCSKLLVYKNEQEIETILKNKKGKARMNEIKNIVKNVSYCQKANYGCGAPIPKIKQEKKKTTAEINIIAEYSMGGDEDNKDKKVQVQKDIISPLRTYNILKNISDRDCLILGLDPTKSRPEDMIYRTFPVPPIQVRPSVRGDFVSTTREDHLTVKISDIFKANARIIKHKENINENTIKYNQDHIAYLQYHVATYFDNESLKLPQSEQKGIMTKSLSSRLKGKEGRIRNNLMGKRVNFSGRTVITPDPTISINEIGVPVKMAMNLTFPEIVTPENHAFLSKLVKNGPNVYPGANFVMPSPSSYDGEVKPAIILQFRKDNIDLNYGDIVERHMLNGDNILVNRQPSLHKLSMMSHKANIINNPDYCTLRLNPNVTTPYNADFDGYFNSVNYSSSLIHSY